MKKIIFTLLIGSSVLFSCKDDSVAIDKSENSSKKIKTFNDYHNFLNHDADNQVIIQSVGVFNNPNRIFDISTNTKANNQPLLLTINNHNLVSSKLSKNSSNTNLTYLSDNNQDIFGNKIKISLSGANIIKSLSESSNEVDFYVPELLNVGINGLVDGKIVPGTKITWNKDLDHEGGIILGVQYSETSQFNQNVVKQARSMGNYSNLSESEPVNIIRGITVDDTGSYQISPLDLKDFPDNALLSFYIVRANTKIINHDENTDTSVGAFSSVRGDFVIDK